jgi:hypothetical protein
MSKEHVEETHSPEKKRKRERLPQRITHTVTDTRVGVYIGGGLVVTGKVLAAIDKSPSLRPVEIVIAAVGAGLAAYASTEPRRKKTRKKKKK